MADVRRGGRRPQRGRTGEARFSGEARLRGKPRRSEKLDAHLGGATRVPGVNTGYPVPVCRSWPSDKPEAELGLKQQGCAKSRTWVFGCAHISTLHVPPLHVPPSVATCNVSSLVRRGMCRLCGLVQSTPTVTLRRRFVRTSCAHCVLRLCAQCAHAHACAHTNSAHPIRTRTRFRSTHVRVRNPRTHTSARLCGASC
eukprot:3224935-Rhodomonas_salina.3